VFDLRDEASTGRKRAESPIPHVEAGDKERESHPLDSEPMERLYKRLLDQYVRELDRQEENRRLQAVDEDFYDNFQWDEADAAEVAERGQMALVYNVISNTVNWVIGTEKRGRSDFHIFPREKNDAKPAERKTALMKYLSDVNRSPFHRSRAFADAVKVGIGWLEDGFDDGGDGEPLYGRYESWRNMLWDSASMELDLSDARYLFRSKWVDLDIAQAIFKGRKSLLEGAARDGERFVMSGDYGDDPMDAAELDMERTGSDARHPNIYKRERCRIVEAWFKVPEVGKRLSGGSFRGEIFDEASRGHVDEVNSGRAELVTKPLMRVHVALFTTGQTGGMLHVSPSPYRHNRFPFTPIWGNRRGRDGLPYGMIRGLKDIQTDINKRASKALYILSCSKTVVDEGAVDDMDELAEEVSRPDAFIVKKPGHEVKFDVDRELSAAHLELMTRDIMMIQQHSGVTDENLGRRTNATSGIAIERRQDQGATSTTHYFDNLRFAAQVQGEKQLSNIEQFMGDKTQFRITNMRGNPEYIDVNDGLPENDIVRSKADYVIGEADWRQTMRQAAADQLLEAMQKMPPEVALTMFDLVVENMDLSNREEIVRRIRAMTGHRDPDAEELTPEEQAAEQAKQEAAALEKALAEATVRKMVAEAVAKEMAAEKARADTVRANITTIGGPKRGAMDIAADISTAPALAPIADEIARDAGYVGRAEKEQAATPALQAAAAAVPPEAAQQVQQQQAAEQAAAAEASADPAGAGPPPGSTNGAA